jgi:hypothetical protein
MCTVKRTKAAKFGIKKGNVKINCGEIMAFAHAASKQAIDAV